MSQSRQPINGRPSSHSNVSMPTTLSSLFVKVKFNNTLPDIPFDPKFLVNPLSISRFVDYESTSLEQNAKHELLTPVDLGVDIDLIQPERYEIRDNVIHDQEDERLINEDDPPPTSAKKSVRDKPHSVLHNKVVPWLKKTEYISTEYNRYGSSNEKTETKVGYNVRKNMNKEEIFLDRDSQIKAINETFDAAQQPIERHPTKPDVYASKIMPLYPDFDAWKYFFAHVKFDSEPTDSTRTDQMSQAIVRGAYDEEAQENFVVYFLPTEVTMADRLLDQSNGLEYTDSKEYEYKSNRQYTWSAKHDSQGDDFFFVFRDDAVFYNRLSMEVMLRKRRNKSHNVVTTLVVKNRDVNEEELDCQAQKLKQLKKPSPPQEPTLDLTAQSLERSYEEMNQSASISIDKVAVEDAPNEVGDYHSSTSSPDKSSTGSATSSEASTSSAEESEDGDDEEEGDDDD